MRNLPLAFLLLSIVFSLCACSGRQIKTNNPPPKVIVGGGCDGCELMYLGMPLQITSTDTSAGWNEAGTRLVINGTVVKRDGQTPAPDVVIYYWQTDNTGLYAPAPAQDERTKRHGHIRSWVKTDNNGRFKICTIRPAPYPRETMPAHIHLSIKEPAYNEYYVDELVFDNDGFLTPYKRSQLGNRGGSGILTTVVRDGIQWADYKMTLGLNIPGYPDK